MITELSRKQPVARNEHRCDFCGGIIRKGEKYNNQSLAFDGTAYSWKSHLHCLALTKEMWNYVEEGISSGEFEAWIQEYVYEHHFDKEADDIEEEWSNKDTSELAKMIYEEMKSKEHENSKRD